jgi:hypothetical protein
VQWHLDARRQQIALEQNVLEQNVLTQNVSQIRVLGIAAFGAGLPHSGAPDRSKHHGADISVLDGPTDTMSSDTMSSDTVLVYHDFQASWLLVDELTSTDGQDTKAGAATCDVVGCASEATRALARGYSALQREGMLATLIQLARVWVD